MVHRPVPEHSPTEPAPPSKSQRKRDMTALQALGESLLRLTPAELARVALPEDLREALAAMPAMGSHEARRRQRQYIGRLMRAVDQEPLQAAIDDATGGSKRAVALMHRCEKLRDALLADDAALARVLTDLPGTDAQPLRAMIRAARREHADGRPPKRARQLYRWLHEQYSKPGPEQ
jgi:ribosome-associated protein